MRHDVAYPLGGGWRPLPEGYVERDDTPAQMHAASGGDEVSSRPRPVPEAAAPAPAVTGTLPPARWTDALRRASGVRDGDDLPLHDAAWLAGIFPRVVDGLGAAAAGEVAEELLAYELRRLEWEPVAGARLIRRILLSGTPSRTILDRAISYVNMFFQEVDDAMARLRLDLDRDRDADALAAEVAWVVDTIEDTGARFEVGARVYLKPEDAGPYRTDSGRLVELEAGHELVVAGRRGPLVVVYPALHPTGDHYAIPAGRLTDPGAQ